MLLQRSHWEFRQNLILALPLLWYYCTIFPLSSHEGSITSRKVSHCYDPERTDPSGLFVIAYLRVTIASPLNQNHNHHRQHQHSFRAFYSDNEGHRALEAGALYTLAYRVCLRKCRDLLSIGLRPTPQTFGLNI